MTVNWTRIDLIAEEIRREVMRSIEKHGDQANLPAGTGRHTSPLRDMANGVTSMVDFQQYWARTARADAVVSTDRASYDGSVTWWHILREEVFEASAEDDPMGLRAELVQVGAVVLKWIEALDRSSPDSGSDQ
ncbi:MAG: hypothetical protein Q8M65_03130 [Rhodoglobus sp.]|nr:hypothetical protein [Rhodoglobus sp.]